MSGAIEFSGEIQFRCGLDFNTHYEIGTGWDQTGKGSQQNEQIINFWKCERKAVVGDGWAIQAHTSPVGCGCSQAFGFIQNKR